MICEKCGIELSSDAKFCKTCGFNLSHSLPKTDYNVEIIKKEKPKKTFKRVLISLIGIIIVIVLAILIHPSSNYLEAQKMLYSIEINYAYTFDYPELTDYFLDQGNKSTDMYKLYYDKADWYEKRLLDKYHYETIMRLTQM